MGGFGIARVKHNDTNTDCVNHDRHHLGAESRKILELLRPTLMLKLTSKDGRLRHGGIIPVALLHLFSQQMWRGRTHRWSPHSRLAECAGLPLTSELEEENKGREEVQEIEKESSRGEPLTWTCLWR